MKITRLGSLFQPTVLLVLALMGIIVMMILPVPAWMLDIGLSTSFALAILIFTVTLFIERPLDFSSFPALLLASLMLRLALNISSTKLIISQGHTGTRAAGSVIEGFANFIMSGSLMQGIVIFCVLMIVNFVVITKGAGRMAEVGARFALDGMPGRQLAIDSDMNAGAIGHDEASKRRERELQEVTFYGSLDGVSKFVKGDAIAGLLITGLTMIVGLAMGVFAHQMPIGQAFETYAVLTIGDGLVGQIPAVIISVAAALLLARGGNNGAIDASMLRQILQYPAALVTVSGLMAVFAIFPGLPFLPFMGASVLLAAAAWWRMKGAGKRAPDIQPKTSPTEPVQKIGDVLDLDDIHIEFAPDLVPMVLDPGTGLDARIASIRNHIAANYGIILPEIRLTDEASLPPGHYAIRIQGVEAVKDRLSSHQVLLLLSEDDNVTPPGETVREPVYGAPARWIDRNLQDQAALKGLTVVAPVEVLATHLLEVIKSHLARLLTLRGLRRLLDEFTNLSDPARSDANRRLLDEVVPDKVPFETLLAVLKLLLEERVSVRNLPLILESLAEFRGNLQGAEQLCEHVRRRLGFQLVAEHKRADGTLPLIQLAPEWEHLFDRYQIEVERGLPDVALPPEDFTRLANQLSRQISQAGEQGIAAALITSANRRRFLRSVMLAKGQAAPVLSFDELGHDVRPALIAVVAA